MASFRHSFLDNFVSTGKLVENNLVFKNSFFELQTVSLAKGSLR